MESLFEKLRGKKQVSRTNRQDWKGRPIKDGDHGKRCPESGCAICMTGDQKRPFRRNLRHAIKRLLKGGKDDSV